jgi:hypothetical protein
MVSSVSTALASTRFAEPEQGPGIWSDPARRLLATPPSSVRHQPSWRTPALTTRTISTTSPLSGGGDLSANRTLALNIGVGLTTSGGNLILANPTASTIGGVQSLSCSSSNWFSTLSTSGVLGCSQPNFTDLAGSISLAQIPNNLLTNAKLATMAAYTLKGNATGSSATPTDIDITALTSKPSPISADIVLIQDSAASNAMKRTTVGALASAGSVSSIAGNTGAFTLGVGLTNSVNDIRVSLPTASNVLGADVAMGATGTFTDGPSMAQGTSGFWWATGSVMFLSTSGAASVVCKLWDGTNTIVAAGPLPTSAANATNGVTLSGFLAIAPAANIRITCKDTLSGNTKMLFNASGTSKDSSIFGHRIQ